MEDVLELYKLPYDPDYPVVCFDESCKQLVSETRQPLPLEVGQPERYDHEYERQGVCNLFMFFEPLAGWRHVEVTDRRTQVDYAQQMKYLADVHYTSAKKIRLTQDNLNTHVKSSLYKAFPPAEARRILDKFEFHYTTPVKVTFLLLSRKEAKGRQVRMLRVIGLLLLRLFYPTWGLKKSL